MDYKYIEQLLERYWNCETSVEEEQILRIFFQQKELPAHLRRYRSLFTYQEEAAGMKLGDDFDKVSSMAVIDAAFNRQVSELDELKTVLQRLSMRQQREQELENGLYAKTMVDFQTMDQE